MDNNEFIIPSNIRLKKLQKAAHCNVFIGTTSKIKSYERAIVCIKEDDKIYKVISVKIDREDESIYVFFPYYKEKQAFIFQHKHKYKSGRQKIKKSQITKEFIVDKTAKLSIHKNGFVQLSGNGILSGIYEETGNPKGVGVFSSPLDNPVSSGPTFCFQCWGLSDGFELLTQRKKDIQYIILDKNKDDFVERKNVKDKKSNTYILEFFIFPKEANQFVCDYEGEPFIDHIMYNYIPAPGAIFAHPVLDLKNFSGVICVFPALVWSQFAQDNNSGYILGSPGGSDCLHDKSMTGNVFCLICPRKISYSLLGSPSKLEYKKSMNQSCNIYCDESDIENKNNQM